MARRIEIGTPTSCGDCPAAAIMLCAGSTLASEGRGADLPERLPGVLSTVVTDAANYGCANPELPRRVATVVDSITNPLWGPSQLNGTTDLAKQVVKDFTTEHTARIQGQQPPPEVTTRLRRNLIRMY